MLPPVTVSQQQPFSVTSLEHSIWLLLHADLELALSRLNLAHLSAPSMLLLHDFVECSVAAMHRKVFQQLVEADFGMVAEDNDATLDDLYKAELAEHGSQNIAQYCREKGLHVAINFTSEPDTIVSISNPVKWDVRKCSTAKLVDALGYQWHEKTLAGASGGCVYALKRFADQPPSLPLGSLLDAAGSAASVQNIHEKLGYGVMRFSSTGQIMAASPAMLASVSLPVHESAVASLGSAIPFNFYNDIVWGMALAGPNGIFENYRIRMHLPGEEKRSVLFNVSGYRDEQSIIHSLWQIVSLADGGVSLAEGSILSDVRVHKITRNYVPQLVEEKAREAVRLGKDKLTNEECQVAVLFCDIVGFTSYVESNASSESIINTLNTILRRVSSSVRRYHGSIDKFMGDSVMAIFRNPADAICAALDMQSHSADINGLRSRAGQDTLRLRIGIHWGEVVIGNVGTAERLDWTAIGDVVNTASRIEKNCNPGAILISQATRDAIVPSHHPEIVFGELFQITVKGKREALSVCHIKHPDDKLTA
jgi:adenylate cyclase